MSLSLPLFLEGIALHSDVAEFLQKEGMEHTLAVFASECGVSCLGQAAAAAAPFYPWMTGRALVLNLEVISSEENHKMINARNASGVQCSALHHLAKAAAKSSALPPMTTSNTLQTEKRNEAVQGERNQVY
mmetsp:Transcript_24813/g.50390  ORF Transcript_24813/g.50390 Transcript_24813/m.50390 type:complete len:131 (-) Transcript_24813:737-1129(-)|eukprot:CAMPEP_0183294570 /NCGR_PEP_ID=MMETSP0160_2-20130417/2857_1 /TAXON_ID=2839 ORGANISM="Odontella Sinensis, Strain Grunow 1884" /NCGR_SAMPLE_ID=MMETSP0160_2 /ASSEMBLY_ACC=CAM_ASM_000250 /LENGTH=130 /DNA_ID=CAMNT_0025455919 /DNA_START=526 /DNA_END=918 /DNA_ORIENTATION=+